MRRSPYWTTSVPGPVAPEQPLDTLSTSMPARAVTGAAAVAGSSVIFSVVRKAAPVSLPEESRQCEIPPPVPSNSPLL